MKNAGNAVHLECLTFCSASRQVADVDMSREPYGVAAASSFMRCILQGSAADESTVRYVPLMRMLAQFTREVVRSARCRC